MKKLCLIALLLLLANGISARKLVTVERGSVTTAPGIGGYAQIGYAFAKGDVVTVNGTAEKKLERMIVMIYPDVEIGRDLATKEPHYTFTMPREGIVVIRFISDRGGTNKVNYSVTRMPASDRVQRYNTRVVWEKPATGLHGRLVPRRAGRR
jgi:hypothetical protein